MNAIEAITRPPIPRRLGYYKTFENQFARRAQVGPYTLHPAPFSRTERYGVSHNGRIVHRCRTPHQALTWALDQIELFWRSRFDEMHSPSVDAAERLLREHGRLQ